MSEKLNPCGDCPEECAIDVVKIKDPWTLARKGYRAVCYECGDKGPLRSTEDKAIAAWNTRAGEKA